MTPGAGIEPAPICVDDFEALARARLTDDVWSYLAGGGADELTLRRNRAAFDEVRLVPRVLRDTSNVDTTCELLGTTLAMPILLAPTALHRLVCPDGEHATARAAAHAKTVFVLSTMASATIADVGPLAPGLLWMQLYIQRDRDATLELVRRVEEAGFTALCLTVDTPRAPVRYRERRTPLRPGDIRPVNLTGKFGGGHHSAFEQLLDPSVTWDDVAWLCRHTRLPVVLKGILHPADARRARDSGAAAIVVSNHGGRNLDTAPATIEVLPGVVAAIGGALPVLVDGGIRRGTDVLKALALGAAAVLIGRPYLFALGCAGEAGVRAVLDLLHGELETAMSLCGVRQLREIDRDLVWPVLGETP